MSDIQIDFARPLEDPSGSGLRVYAVAVEPSYITVKKGTPKTLKFAVKPGSLPHGMACQIHYFRYQNPAPQFNAAWWKPVGSPDPGTRWKEGHEFEDVTPPAKRGSELWIKDKADNDTLYAYVLQIAVTEGPNTTEYVLDPEIHNKE